MRDLRKHAASTEDAQAPTAPIIIRGTGRVRSGTVYRDSNGQVARELLPGRVYHKRAVDDREEQELIRISQAMESGASAAEISAMQTGFQVQRDMEAIKAEVERIRTEQFMQGHQINRQRHGMY